MHFVLRADANAAIGSGHLMRGLALAQAWRQRGWPVTVVSRCDSEAPLARFAADGCAIRSLGAEADVAADVDTICRAAEARDAWVAVDGYTFGTGFQVALRDAGLRVLVVDDSAHLPRYEADVILNQNPHACQLHYDCDPSTVKLFGPQYALLRREFLARMHERRDIAPTARTLLVTLGGSDAHGQTEKVLEAVTRLQRPDLDVVVGVGPHRAPIDAWPVGGIRSVTIRQNPSDMAELMAAADLAVCGGGTSCWEMAAMGVPQAIVTLADNQRPNALEVTAAGAAVNLGWFEELSAGAIAREVDSLIDDADRRRRMRDAGRRLVDGRGADRVVHALLKRSLCLRRLRRDDAPDLWRWANDPEVRSSSFSTEPIAWDTHVAWLDGRLRNSWCHDFVVLNADGERPIGQVRFDVADSDATINVSLDAEYRHRGYGAAGIDLACDTLFAARDVRRVIAHVKAGNESSLRAFHRAGFIEIDATGFEAHGAEVLHLARSRPTPA